MSTQKMAAIAVKNNRLKAYKGNNEDVFYLKDEDEFQIELFNPKQYPVLAKIWMNGKVISNSGLVLRPGQHFFLERYIDTNNKFVFRTYDVDGENAEVLKAIEDNGSVKVIFYREKIKQIPSYPIPRGPFITTTQYPYFGTTGNPITYSTNTAFFSSTGSASMPIGGSVSYTSSVTMDGMVGNDGPSGPSGIQAKSFETGRVEMGGSSNQNFGTIDMDFENYPCETVIMKIMAESNKPIEVSDIRNYCSDCGTRMKKQTWKFCPNCGSKID
jgi:Zn finger protein HypA/HybF involved in hydrogenase expression